MGSEITLVGSVRMELQDPGWCGLGWAETWFMVTCVNSAGDRAAERGQGESDLETRGA